MITAAGSASAVKDFVTVVAVDGTRAALQHQHQHQHQQHQQPPHAVEDSFVTVLSIGGETTTTTTPPPTAVDSPPPAEEVLVYRLPGERLGFGLRFDGVDTCNRLFVQSCADGSPASRTHASWGPLSAGDEIVRINGRPVNRLSRDDCVRCLKESGLVVKLHMVDGRARAPPPVPPRKQRRPEPPPPPPVAAASSAAVYTDAVERFVYHGESESDDTNSSVSTVVSKCRAASSAGDECAAADAKNCVLDRVLEPFMQLEREFSSSAAIGDDVGLYEKLVAVAEEDRLPPKPLPRKEVRPPKKKPPPPPPPLIPSAQPLPPPPPYRLPPRLVDFVHKDEPPQPTAEVDVTTDAAEVDVTTDAAEMDVTTDAAAGDADDDDVFANADSISCPSTDENIINTMHQDGSPIQEDRESSCDNGTADLTSSHEPDRSRGGGGGSRDDDGGSPIMKSSYSQTAAAAVDSGRTDSETDSDGPKYGASATRRPTGRTDEVCGRSVRDKIAMFSRTVTVTAANGGEKKDSSSSSSSSSSSASSSSAYSTGSPDSSPAASPKPAAYYSTLPRKPPAQPYCPTVPAAAQQQQRPQQQQRTAAASTSSTSSSCPQPQQSDHRRSQSLVEQPYSKYFNTMNAYAEMGRSSLNALIEQRRRSMSKLRGLVIPEKVPGCGGVGAAVTGDAVDDGQLRLGGAAAHPAVVIPDLPLVIKSPPGLPRSDYDDDDDDDGGGGGGGGGCPAAPAVLCPPTKTYVNGPPPVMGTATRYASPVKTVARQPAATVPPPVVCGAVANASPAEQRRPASAAVAPEQRRPSSASSSPSSSSSASSSSSSSSSSLNSSREELRHIHDERPPSDGSKGSFKADSDEDSALSSSRSSTSLQQYSPASSPPPPPVPSSQPPALAPSSSSPPPSTARVVAAPSACSDAGKRVLKAESVEAINRKNVLCSARISSGKPEAPPQQPPVSGNHVKTEFYHHHHHHHHHQPPQQVQQQADGGVAAAVVAAVPAVKSSTAKTAFAVNGTGNGGSRYTHNRMSSMESTTSDDSSMQYAVNAEPFGSISSLASSTSLISQQELQQLIDDANQTLEENGCGATATAALPVSVEVMVVILHRDMATSSVGITLAGGADYEAKEITVYKVLTGSPADKDGRIRKGDRILSINGKSMKGLTHRESLAILKAPRSEVVLVISRCKSDATVESSVGLPQSIDLMTTTKNDVTANRVFGPLTKVILSKDGSGLGFSLDGGKNSPTGDQPLTVKKIFTGGCAEQCGQILAGDELVSVNDIDVTGMSRTEAWNLMKRLVNGTVTLCIRHVV